MKTLKDSLLMCDSTEGDGKAEIVMDYVMSYSLRHAEDEYKKENKQILSKYCRYMLGKLLGIAIDEATCVTSVKVWKEWHHMDLCAEVKLTRRGQEEYYALLIENKYYSPLHYKRDAKGTWRNQVDVYKEIFESYYNSLPDKEKWNLRYALVSCFESSDNKIHMYDEALKFGCKVFGFYDLFDDTFKNKETGTYEETESEIFNEFWLRKW